VVGNAPRKVLITNMGSLVAGGSLSLVRSLVVKTDPECFPRGSFFSPILEYWVRSCMLSGQKLPTRARGQHAAWEVAVSIR